MIDLLSTPWGRWLIEYMIARVDSLRQAQEAQGNFRKP
jgi:hypothetical protein